MPRLLTCLLLLSVLGLGAAPAVAADMIDNPAYQQWAHFKVGSWSKMQQTMSAQDQEMHTTIEQKLTALDDTKAVVQMQVTMNVAGQTMTMPGHAMTIPARIAKDDQKAQKVEATTKAGTEQVSVSGKTIQCHWTEGTMRYQGSTFQGRWDTSAAVPGGMVKMNGTVEGDGQGGKIEMTLLDFESVK